MAKGQKQYVPTSEELIDAVMMAMKDTQTPTPKGINRMLEIENPTWKIPERKVNKLVKKEIRKQKREAGYTPEDDFDDDVSSVSSTSSFVQRAGQRIRGSLGGKKHGTTDTDSVSIATETSRASKGLRFKNRKWFNKGKADVVPPITTPASVDTTVPSVATLEMPKAVETKAEEKEEALLGSVTATPDGKDVKVFEPTPALALGAESAARTLTYEDDNDGDKDGQLCGGACAIF